MLPYIGSIPILGLILVVISIRLYTSTLQALYKTNIDNKKFVSQVGWLLIGVIFCASYMYYLLSYQIFIPLSWQQILLYLSPQSFNYHSITGLAALWIAAAVLIHQYPIRNHNKILDIFVRNFLKAMIFVGIGLLLHDNFFMLHDTRGITPLSIHSIWANFEQVIPLGPLLSIWSLLCYGLYTIFCKGKVQHPERLHYILGLRLIGLCIMTILQHYPRHIVMLLGGIRLDIKQYILCIMILYHLYRGKQIQQSVSLSSDRTNK